MAEVRLERITKQYGQHKVVDEVNLDVADGEFLVLLGPSGCGKTTTLRMIAGLVTPTSGGVRIGGTDVTATPVRRRNIGMIFQDYALFPHMTVGENIALWPHRTTPVAQAGRGARARAPRAHPAAGLRSAVSRATLGRAAAAHRPRTRAGLLPRAASHGRAAGRAGSQAARSHADRAAPSAARVARHHHPGDARSGGGDVARRSHRHHGGGAGATGGRS